MDEKEPGDFGGGGCLGCYWSTTKMSESHGPRGTLKSRKEVMGSSALKLCVRFVFVKDGLCRFEGSGKSALKTCGRQYLLAGITWMIFPCQALAMERKE